MKALDQLRSEAPGFMEDFEAHWEPPGTDGWDSCTLCGATVSPRRRDVHKDWHLALSARMALDYLAIHVLGLHADIDVEKLVDEYKATGPRPTYEAEKASVPYASPVSTGIFEWVQEGEVKLIPAKKTDSISVEDENGTNVTSGLFTDYDGEHFRIVGGLTNGVGYRATVNPRAPKGTKS